MIPSALQNESELYAADIKPFVNRTGGATVEGGVYAIDFEGAQAESQTDSAPDAKKTVRNIATIASTNIKGHLVVAMEAKGDNEVVLCAKSGQVPALVEGTTDVDAGDQLHVLVGEHMFKKDVGTWAGQVTPAISLEDQHSNAGVLTLVLFDGKTFGRTGV